MDIRNVAIIAHVDHGKTTLVDGLLKQTHTFRDNQAEMSQTTILDSNVLEREKGITILAKNTAIQYQQTKINIIDTPGHADFSGEVERVINMADGALLVIDAAEGPLPQTQFVLQKALDQNLKIIVVINKIDRKDARPREVLRLTEELFLHLVHHEDQLHFSVIYAHGREGKAWRQLPENFAEKADLTVLLEEIVNKIPAPDAHPDLPFKMLVSTLDFDNYKGTYAIGKVTQGTIKPGQNIVKLWENEKLGNYKVEGVFTSIGLVRIPIAQSDPGDIIALTGVSDVMIGQTLADPGVVTGFTSIKLTEPTLKIVVSANTSPLAGREGKFCTAKQLAERLFKEKKTNIGLKITPSTDNQGFVVAGRGELHLAILLENLRREGYEMQVSKPEVIFKENNGVTEEPFEDLTVEIPLEYIGIITEEMGKRKGEMLDTFTDDRGITKLVYRLSTRNLLGFRGSVLTRTRGTGIFASNLVGYFPLAPQIAKIRNGVIISLETGKATAYALESAQERGKTFIAPGATVYEGMIIGESNRQEDMEINIIKSKKLTNMHTENSDIAVHLDSPVIMSVEQCLDYIENDELIEITPISVRLRKKHLTKAARNRVSRGLSPNV